MRKILFICRANVGRSQMAEGYYNAFAKRSCAISAGVIDLRKKYHGRPAPDVLRVMLEDEIAIGRQKVMILTEEMMRNADRVIVLCERQEVPEFLTKLVKTISYREIADPFGKGIEDIRNIRDEIKTLVREILKEEEGML